MTRPISYLAYNKRTKELCPVLLICFINQYVDVMPERNLEGGNQESWSFDEIELMQWTGLRDINNVPIHEGDIVHIEYGAGKVVFVAGCFMIEWLDDKEANMELLSMRDYKGGRLREDLVVTGNIYQHQHLL
jgi:uncharacterized phage protein (TIGR01671 family)